MQILPFDNREGTIWVDGKFIDWKNARMHILNHGLHYGSCVFEGIRMYEGKIFKLEEHIKRLFDSAILDIPLIETQYDCSK